ncbi:MAG: hypothetical protein HDS16_05310 [Bacteroides sp.]|nr:hypothetical protein [Bacteroides sp.]
MYANITQAEFKALRKLTNKAKKHVTEIDNCNEYEAHLEALELQALREITPLATRKEFNDMENLTYNNIGAVLQLDKHGELIQKRMKAAKVCDGLFVTEPDKSGYTQFICELDGVVWLDCKAAANRIADGAKMIPGYFENIKAGMLDGEYTQEFKREISRRINRPDAPAIMELKQPERKKRAPLAAKGQNAEAEDGGTIRAKVLQYKSDGNTLTEKWETLTMLTEGIYYTKDVDGWDNPRYVIFFEDNGVFWYSLRAFTESQFNNSQVRERVMNLRNNFRANIKEIVQNNGFIRSLEIEVFKRLGEDTAPLVASRETYLKRREEEERQKAEEVARRERERKEADDRRKAELLADGKEKLMANQAVTVEQIELLAESVGYKIHIRTIGFMREKVSEAVLNADETVTVWGRKLTQRNISGTANVLREIAARIKAQGEKEAQQPATPSEMPQISTGSTEANISAESEKREIKHISEIMGTCQIVVSCCDSPDGIHTYTDEYNYYSWLRVAETIGYQTMAEKALTGAWINIFQAAYKRGKGHVLAMNKLGELVDTVFTLSVQPVTNSDNLTQPHKQATQLRKTSLEVNNITPPPKAQETAQKRQISANLNFSTSPPGFKFIITQNNQSLKLKNHDRNNCLAHSYLHNRPLRLSRLPVGSGNYLRHLCMWHLFIMVTCKTYRQVRKKESRGSPHRPREGNR